MVSEPLILVAVILVSLTSVYILISADWRYCVAALAIQYIGVFVLVYASWPLEMAVAKMVAGWMAGAILGIAMTSGSEIWRNPEQSVKFGPVFRILAAVIIALAITTLVLNSES